MDRRLLLAILLGLGVAAGFAFLMERTKDGPPERAAAHAAGAVAAGHPPATPATRGAAERAAGAQAEAAAPPAAGQFENDHVAVTVSSRYGAITSWRLKDPRYYEEVGDARVPVDLAEAPGGVLALHCYDSGDPNYAELCPVNYILRREGPKRIALESVSAPTARVRVRQKYEFGDSGDSDGPYVVHREVTIEPADEGATVANLVLWTGVGAPRMRDEKGGSFLSPTTNVQQGVCRVSGETETKERDEVGSGSRSHGAIGYVGVQNTYFLSAVGFETPDPPDRRDFCLLGIDRQGPRPALRAALQLLPMDLDRARTFRLAAYFGPKNLDALQGVVALDALEETIDFGWFGPISVVMLRVMRFFHALVASWGVAIILLTIVVRVLLFPLTHWSAKSMRRMGALKPLMDEINERFKDDKQRRTQAIMDLYKTHKVNPLSGCLPLIIQMPIWIALYRAIGNSAELYHTPFLYLPDLTHADPYYILPLVLGAAMFVQQKITPTTADSTQAKMMMYAMPIVFVVFMLFLPSGLNVYILASTLIGIVQQQITNKLVPAPVLAVPKGVQGGARAPAAPEGEGMSARQRRRRKR